MGDRARKDPVQECFRQLSRHYVRVSTFSVLSVVFFKDGIGLIYALVKQLFQLAGVHAVLVQELQAIEVVLRELHWWFWKHCFS